MTSRTAWFVVPSVSKPMVGGLTVCRLLARDGDALRPIMRRLIADLRSVFWGRPAGLPRVWNC